MQAKAGTVFVVGVLRPNTMLLKVLLITNAFTCIGVNFERRLAIKLIFIAIA